MTHTKTYGPIVALFGIFEDHFFCALSSRFSFFLFISFCSCSSLLLSLSSFFFAFSLNLRSSSLTLYSGFATQLRIWISVWITKLAPLKCKIPSS